MHIHTVIVSYKRQVLTERTLEAYLETVNGPHSLIIVDNCSPPDVIEWLSSLDVPVLFLPYNRFPGYATNRGWEKMPPETALLHRLDNDTALLPGWCEEAREVFQDPSIGQYGLIGEGDAEWLALKGIYTSGWNGWPCGGNSIISRKLYDEGIRFSEHPWTSGGNLEDTQMTRDIWTLGYQRVFSTKPVMAYMSIRDDDYDREIKASKGLS